MLSARLAAVCRSATLLVFCLIFACRQQTPADTPPRSLVAPSHRHLRYVGYIDDRDPQAYRFAWTGVQVATRFTGTELTLLLDHSLPPGVDTTRASYYRAEIDGMVTIFRAKSPSGRYPLARRLRKGIHTFELFKLTEAETGVDVFRGLELGRGDSLMAPPPETARLLLCFGNSITCGYGNRGSGPDCDFSPETEDGYHSYAAIAARTLQAAYVAVAYSGRGGYQNYSRTRTGTLPQLYDKVVPGEDLAWDMQRTQPAAILINLGTNDFAHANPDSAAFVGAYLDFVGRLRQHYPDVPIVCLTGSMMQNQGVRQPLATLQRYLAAVQTARRDGGDAQLYRFDLSPQGSLGYGCDWHPSLEQHAHNAAELVAFLRDELGW
ncbi:MAG: SGNH/GDSL hydrolase family protein [Bacteroidia bacterium]